MRHFIYSFLFVFILFFFGCNLKEKRTSIRFEKLEINLPEGVEANFDLPDFYLAVFPDRIYDIEEFGAREGGEEKVTEPIQKAIDHCSKSGGGKVVVPKGKWLSGPIHLKSNVNLQLHPDAELIFSEDKEDYLPVVLIQRGGFFCYNYSPPIYANEVENIAITGKGTINGNGQHWWPWKQNQPGMVTLFEMGKSGVPIEERVFGEESYGVRPPFIQFINSKNILIEGVTLVNGPSWNLHPVFCENMVIRGIIIHSHGPNNDGIDIDGCKHVLIEDCLIDVGDDNICLKSGRDEEAWKLGKPTESVIIRNSKTKAGHGGFVIGSEMSAGVKDVLVYGCEFDGTSRGIRMKSRLGRGGVVENIKVQDIKMDNIRNEAIVLSLRYDGEPIERDMGYSNIAESAPPTFKDIELSGITCQSAGSAILFEGLPGGEYLKDILLRDITITARENGGMNHHHRVIKERVVINGVKLDSDD